MKLTLPTFFLALLTAASTAQGAAPTPGENAWADWVHASAQPVAIESPPGQTDGDLKIFADILGSASLFGLTESNHGLHETLALRNRIFPYFVKHGNFRAISLESGVLEAQLVERFVQGDPSVSIDQALREGITHRMGLSQENKSLLLWIKAYNGAQTDAAAKVHFFGFDLPVTGDAPLLPLQQLAPYLQKNEPAYSKGPFSRLLNLASKQYAVTQAVRATLKANAQKDHPGMDLDEVEIDPDLLDSVATIGFDQLTFAEKNQLDQGIQSTLQLLRSQAATLMATTGEDAYQWNAHLAEIAAQHMRNLRSREKTSANPSPHTGFGYARVVQQMAAVGLLDGLANIDVAAYDVDINNLAQDSQYLIARGTRELMAAENVEWAQKRYGRTFIYAHIGHLTKSPEDVRIGDVHVGKESQRGQGIYLAQKYGSDYRVVALDEGEHVNSAGQAQDNENGLPFASVADCDGCVDKAFLADTSAAPALAVNLHEVSGPALEWLRAADHPIRYTLGFQSLRLLDAVDGLVFLKKAGPVNPLE